MNGRELAKAYYEEYGAPMLHELFPEWESLTACGLIGSGSECIGYDDEISQDHDFEAGFCLFIPGEEIMDRQTAFRLERAYAKLPKEFMGFQRSFMRPVGGARHGVLRTDDFFTEKIGTPDGILSVEDWLRLPEHSLFELSRGVLFRDDSGLVSQPLSRVSLMPEDVRLKKLAGELLLMAQAGQYNYGRCLRHGESGAAQLAAGEFVRSALHAAFLLNGEFLPYYKWQFRALRGLPLLSELAEPLEYLISSGNDPQESNEKGTVIEEIAAVIIAELMEQDLTKAVCGDLEKHAYSVNDGITDGELRNRHILSAV